MKTILVSFLFFPFFLLNAQSNFEKGSFTTLNGDKTECFIKLEDWSTQPIEFKYRTSLTSETTSIPASKLKNIVTDKFLFERHLVPLHRYSKDLRALDENRQSTFNKENLLLQLIVDGNAKLYKYNSNGVNYFFYQLEQKIQPLEYKEYKTPKGTLGKNLNFRKTLKENINCKNQNSSINYTEKNLTKYFVQFNNCKNSKLNVYKNLERKDDFNIRPKVSLTNSSAESIQLNNYSDSKITFKFGVELEYILAFDNNKWSIFIEPTYHSFESQVFDNFKLSFQSIEIPIALRRYMNLGEKSRLFANIGFSFDQIFQKELIERTQIPADTDFTYLFGIGYEFQKKYSIELRYNTSKNLSKSNTNNIIIDYSNISLKFGYNLL